MRAGRTARLSRSYDDLADAYELTDLHVDLRESRAWPCQAAAVVDLDHVAIAAFPAGDAHFAAGGGVHRFADFAAQVDASVDAGRPRNGSRRMPNGELMSTSPTTGLARHPTGCGNIGCSARATVDAVELALEGAGTRDAAALAPQMARRAGARRRLGGVDAEIAEHAAPTARFGVDALFQIGQHGVSAGRPCRARRKLSELPSSPPASLGLAIAYARRQFAIKPRLASGGAVKITPYR